uniref:Uncharacterized protein n=1 Tax=Octactis speculum TaxID=3111310 RepID=A0A7S2BQ23_9STRA|mmetsp:Transcript_25771/g.35460  ORF Transcript_25771/g.35460 Transcript_25771/m.35460 type:complete len:520 (+) Transcript_25771:25-1584(+)
METLPGNDKSPLMLDVFGGPLMGQDKWLGGELDPDSGVIYGIPGSASQVLSLSPTKVPNASLVGPHFQGKLKWLRGIHAPENGCIYGVPANADGILKISPPPPAANHHTHLEDANDQSTTPDITTIDGPYPGSLLGKWKWHGAVRVPRNGCIYGIPCNATSVLKIEPVSFCAMAAGEKKDQTTNRRERVTLIGCSLDCVAGDNNNGGSLPSPIDPHSTEEDYGHDNPNRCSWSCSSCLGAPMTPKQMEKPQKWYGGLLSTLDGCIYGIPNSADCVLQINPYLDTVRMVGLNLFPPGGWKWHGGVVTGEGVVYGVPAHADTVLKIQPRMTSQVAHEIQGFLDPQVSLLGDASVIRPGKGRPGGQYKYGGGVYCARTHKVFCIPSDADRVLVVDCGDGDAIRAIGEEFSQWTHNKWQNGFVSPHDGCIYAIPLNATAVLRIDPLSEEVSLVGTEAVRDLRKPEEVFRPPAHGDVISAEDDEMGAKREVGVLVGRDKWEGGVIGTDGRLYCMPMRSKSVLVI